MIKGKDYLIIGGWNYRIKYRLRDLSLKRKSAKISVIEKDARGPMHSTVPIRECCMLDFTIQVTL